MITEIYNSKSKVFNQRLRARTELFDKTYYWLTDNDGTWYLLPDKDGKPEFV